jgi:diaminopimelate epimerase
MKKIKFSKLNGQGNDFIIINATTDRLDLSKIQIIKMCNKNYGVGADGLILVRPSKVSDLKMEYYNYDGSIAEMCGNGIRCMARFAYENNLIKSKNIGIETLAGIKKISIDIEDNEVVNIKVDMGKPEFRPENIPVNIKNKTEVFNHKISIDSKIFFINCISMGNPHCVIFLQEGEDINTIPLSKWGSKLENYKIFPNKTNVEFVQIKNDRELNMRVWERGIGETLACGTGACAAAVCAVKLKKVKVNNIIVNLMGGKLNVIWDPSFSEVFLEGRVDHNFDGEYFI